MASHDHHGGERPRHDAIPFANEFDEEDDPELAHWQIPLDTWERLLHLRHAGVRARRCPHRRRS